MSRFIKYKDSHSGDTVYLNTSAVAEARYKAADQSIELVVGDPSGKCESRHLRGSEAEAAKSLLDGLTT